jgi:hypothetical protein
MENKRNLKYLTDNYCSMCRLWVRGKDILLCPVCRYPMRLGNGASKRKHGVKISGITGKLVQIPGEVSHA